MMGMEKNEKIIGLVVQVFTGAQRRTDGRDIVNTLKRREYAQIHISWREMVAEISFGSGGWYI